MLKTCLNFEDNIYDERSNYIDIILITIKSFYNFQLNNIFLKLIIGLKLSFFHMDHVCKISY